MVKIFVPKHLGYVAKHHSLNIEGRIKVKYPDGTEKICTGITKFCTCGMSKNKPFCSDECIEEIRPPRIDNDYDRIKTLVNIKDEQFGKNND